ncbi:c2H2-type domain-containing protein [Trichonephila clavata]|uniref:DNA-directed DNA polymerase n=1 Tax=Trichonephila clavata TaxID=2740835 RepID=A0A8X6LQV5_TRICU|nr:c2H2-type domain-containing protein [Trichonephila clavata]
MFFHKFCVYADIESITEKVLSVEPSNDKSFSRQTEIHRPEAYSILLVDDCKKIVYHKFYCGLDVIANLVLSLQNISKAVLKYMERNIPMNKNDIISQNKCHLCGKLFSKRCISVRNHDHFTGKLLGKACEGCNLNYKVTQFLPIVMHTLSGYDSHLILKEISSNLAKKIKIIPVNTQKCMSFCIDNLVFLDSFLFLPCKLSTLIENLKQSDHKFPIFNSFFYSYDNRKHLLRKGVFPYSYFDSFVKLKNRKLPPKSAFFNNLTNENISENEYRFAKFIFSKFKCQNFEDYLRLYLNTDVVLLAEVFENFRTLSMDYFQLDPVHFYTTPSLTWSAGIKTTNVTLELLTDIDIYLMLEAGIRGGMCQVSKRYSKANNKYLDNFDELLESKFILLLDVNNLYGTAMAFYKLPESEFRFLNKKEMDTFSLMSVTSDSNVGYILEVDIFYPPELHSKHNSFPMAPQHETINYDMLSPYQKNLCKQFNIKINKNCKKLLNTFNEKKIM